ncbi:hypothetical protein ABW19_dt0209149 [Dactylella cylindrospora]|nr:hypothetical protein ABW19_dt0209149 [Dactylella cylindrospora]
MALVPQAQAFDNLKEVDEETLIKSRLITVEVKTINRVQKRCNTIISSENLFADVLSSFSTSKDDANIEMTDVGTDGPLSSDNADKAEAATPQESIDTAAEKLAEEILLDFAPLEEALMRIQLLTDANRKEVARYEQKRVQIEQASEKARNDMISLNSSLSEAHKLKQHKLEYDVIATEITSSPNSQKTRQAQYDSIARLNAEIEALEREKAEYGKVWAARRAQFGAIVEALMGMQAQIQEDKEEQERREGLDDDEEEGEKNEGSTEKEGAKGDGDAAATHKAQEATTAETSKAEDSKDGAADVVMEDTQMEEGERTSTRDHSTVTSPRYEEGEEIEEGEEREEREEGEETDEEVSVAPTPRPEDASFEEMETDERHVDPTDPDEDMEDDGAIEEPSEAETQDSRAA